MRLGLACALLGASIVAFGAGPAGAQATCVYPAAYPGDSAAKDKIAAWMAGGAQASGIPAELPVMASLGETGLANIHYGDADSVGYFQMRKSIWEASYPNFENDPTQQLKWFTNQAVATRQAKVNAGDATYGADPLRYGEWIADVERPPEQQRGKYQPYLEQSRSLIASGCAAETTPDPANPSPGAQLPTASIEDTTAPGLTLTGPRTQDPARSGVIAVVVTATENSTATLTATISVGSAARVYRVKAPSRQILGGRSVTLRVRLSRKLRGVVRTALQRGKPPKVTATVVLLDSAGNRSSKTRTIRLPRRHRS